MRNMQDPCGACTSAGLVPEFRLSNSRFRVQGFGVQGLGVGLGL